MTVFKGNNGGEMGVFGKQTCSRLRKCSKRAFSPIGNYSGISEAGNVKLPAFYNEVRV
mgnify:CR=1 FL=1